MDRSVLVIALASCAAVRAFGQCPERIPKPAEVVVTTLEGQLVYHDSIRQWFELKLDQPQCGQASIELVRGKREWKSLEVLRSCRVRSRGPIGFSPTGYYSLAVYQDAAEIEPVGACVRQPPFPDYSNAEPDKTVLDYRVEMHVDYEPGDHPIVFSVSHAGKELRPWQAYASYSLTGLFVLYGSCGKGFVVDEVFGTPQANPSHFDEPRTSGDMAMFDPESAAASGRKDLHLGFTCVRKR
jgi:hypothetical protein